MKTNPERAPESRNECAADSRGAQEQVGLIDPQEDTDDTWMAPLTGGVSSDIWLVTTRTRRFCVKRALVRLKVDAVWEVPVERNAIEAAWLEQVGAWMPASVPVTLPMPEVQISGGGAHAGRRVDVQDFMVVPTGAETIAEAFEIVAGVYHAAGRIVDERGLSAGVVDEGGYWPAFDSNEEALEALTEAIERSGRRVGEEVAISLDIAASEFATKNNGGTFAYRLALEDRSLKSDEMVELIADWCERFPIVSVEDPLDEADEAGLRKFLGWAKGRVQVVGDDHLVTDAERVRRAAELGTVDALLVKPNQAGTVSEPHAALRAAQDAGMGTIVSARSGETEDVTIAHMAVGWDAGQIKVGSSARSERMAKWNELIRIEEALGDQAVYAGMRAWKETA